MYYPSEKDPWITVLIWGVVLVMLADGIFELGWGVFMVPALFSNALFKFIFILGINGLLLWVWFRTGYTIASEWLTVHYGPYKKHIRVQDIEKIVPVKDPFMAPALSSERLEVHYGPGKFIKISPKFKKDFLQNVRKGVRDSKKVSECN